jgi:hypothetical protein
MQRRSNEASLRCGENRSLGDIGTSLYNLAEMVYEAGVKLVCDLTNAAIQAIQTTANKIVDAFQAFVDWLVDFVCDTILAPLTSMIEDVWNGVVDWAAGLGATLSRLAAEVGSGNISVASASLILIKMIMDSVAFTTITLMGLAIYAAMLVLQPMLAPFVFVLGTVVPIVMMAILETTSQVMGEAIDAASSAIGEVGQAIVESVLGSALVNDVALILSIIFGGMSALLDSIVFTVGGSFLTFAFSLFGAFLSIIAMVEVLSSGCSLNILVIAILGAAASGSAIVADYYSESMEEELCPSYDACSNIISLTSFGVSIIGLGTAVYSYNEGS